MTKDLVRRPTGTLSTDMDELVESARWYTENARSSNTRRAYNAQWRKFETWCRRTGHASLPATPQTLILYLSARADEGVSVSTLSQTMGAIQEVHRAHGYPKEGEAAPWLHPLVREALKGARRARGAKPVQKEALLPEHLRALCAVLDEDDNPKRAARDRALLLVAFAGAFRRSEVVAIAVEDLTFKENGLLVAVPFSKTDQEGAGATVGIPFAKDRTMCPVRALRRWLNISEIAEGPVFRHVDKEGRLRGTAALSDGMVARIAKKLARLAGYDPKLFAGHSLRAGLATAAIRAGRPVHVVMAQGRWESSATLDRYVRPYAALENNAADGLL